MTERLIPADTASERAILSRLISYPMLTTKTILKSSDFHEVRNKLIFKAIMKLGNQANAGTVRLELDKANETETTGGTAYLGQLIADPGSSADAHLFEYQVKNKSMIRERIGQISTELEKLYDPSTELTDISGQNGIYKPEDFRERVFDYYRNGDKERWSTGIHSVHDQFTLSPHEFLITTGIPSHGKSSVIDQILINLWRNHGVKTALYSPEHWPLERHLSTLLEKLTYRPFRPGPTERIDEPTLDHGLQELNDAFTFIYPEDDELTLDHILAKYKISIAKHGCKAVVLDPYNELDAVPPPGVNSSDFIGMQLGKMRKFARTMGVLFILVAHPRIMEKDANDNYKIPSLYSISGSANYYNKADIGLTVYRDVMDGGNITDLHVQKVKFRFMGDPGKVELIHNHVTGEFT